MSVKTTFGVAVAAATCLTAIAMLPVNAQPAGPYGPPPAPPAYQDNAYPAQGYTSPDWSQGGYGSTPELSGAPSTAGTTVMVEHPPRVNPGDLNWNPIANVKEAQRYEQLLRTNPAFRAARMQKECGPITDPQLKADCIASFDQYEPLVASGGTSAPRRVASSRHQSSRNVGSSSASHHYQSSSGR